MKYTKRREGLRLVVLMQRRDAHSASARGPSQDDLAEGAMRDRATPHGAS